MCGICHCTYGHRKLRYGCAKNQTALAKEFQFMFAKKLQKTLPQKYRYKHNAYSDILGSVFTTPLFTPLSKRLQNSARGMEPVLINLSVAGTGSPSVLRRRVLAPYVPLRTRCSESAPATDRLISTGSIPRAESLNLLCSFILLQ